MAKQKISFECTNCALQSAKWVGCCPACSEWNSFIEQTPTFDAFAKKSFGGSGTTNMPAAELFQLDDINIQAQERMQSGIKEWDRVLGGGVLPGSFIILTGDPGIGKSTLLLQVADRLAQEYEVVYFSSEESLQQVKNRANRLEVTASHLRFSDQSYLEGIVSTAKAHKPALIILDSIQNCHLSPDSHAIPGTIAQLREAGFILMRLAKENNIAVLITGHITKEGQMAGPKVLEHMVDAVFYLQGEDRWQSRILRSVKNRFGTINEVGFFEMREEGLEEIANINQHLLGEASQVPGAALVCSIEGSRPLLLELQALTIQSKFGMPQRVVTGMDPKRIVLIAAILEKYLYIKFSMQDIFFKVSGGFKIKESSSDLGIALALLSSYFQKPLPPKSLALAEISLTGQIKPANQVGMCIKEAEKFGIDTIFIARAQTGIKSSCRVIAFQSVYELLNLFPEDK
ncbi:DNA repair protein RadA [Candidatus Dependentiae bacterium]|nr:DNA repair protein RadA [Candidatus Dependentiae bacterium]